MTAGEDIEVRAPISARLAHGLEEYQRVLTSWYGYRLTPVRIHAPLEPAAPVPGGAVLTAFSGGVDSFYTLRAHVAGQEPDERARITHGLFVHGFDLPLSNVAAYEGARAGIVETLAGLGIDLIAGRTNVQSFLPRRDWGLFHGGALLGSALALGGGVRRLYVPASHTIGHLIPWGSSPLLDPLLSTEALEIVHDGADATRVQKTAAIGDWPPTFGRLRVCGSLPNCCRCEKCVRTMVTLDLFGLLGRQTSFPLPLSRSHIRACRYRKGGELFVPGDLIAAAVARRRWDLALDVAIALRAAFPRWPGAPCGTGGFPAPGHRAEPAAPSRVVPAMIIFEPRTHTSDRGTIEVRARIKSGCAQGWQPGARVRVPAAVLGLDHPPGRRLRGGAGHPRP